MPIMPLNLYFNHKGGEGEGKEGGELYESEG
jgi:hypothetical protein